jgi:peptidoglycan/LPS O-acetylase OafA/YrhL
MLLCYLIYPYIFQIVDSARDAIDGEIRLLSITSAITVLALVIALYEKDMFGNVNIALLRLPVFIAGCFYGRSSYEKRESYWKWLILFALSGYLLTMLPSGSPIFARYVTGIFNISCCAGIAWIFSQLSMRPVIRILEWFGAHSLELYLVHVTIRKFMKGAAFHTCHSSILITGRIDNWEKIQAIPAQHEILKIPVTYLAKIGDTLGSMVSK